MDHSEGVLNFIYTLVIFIYTMVIIIVDAYDPYFETNEAPVIPPIKRKILLTLKTIFTLTPTLVM